MDALAPWHIALIGLAALVLFFGWRRLPDMARSIGRSLRIVREEAGDLAAGKRDVQTALHNVSQDTHTALSGVTGRPASRRLHG